MVAQATELAGIVLAQAPNTSGVQQWLLDNLVPLIVVLIGIIVLWKIGKTGDNKGAASQVVGLIIGFAIIGFALSGAGVDLGAWIAGLFTGGG